MLPGRTLSVSLRSTAPPRGGALGRTGKFRPHSSTAGRSLPLSCKLYALAKASPFRERWHGEAVTERVAFGTNPLSLAALDSSPEGGALGRTSKFCPHSSTAGRSQPISGKLYSSAKASPFRERWHGEAGPERVFSRFDAAFSKRLSKSEPGQNRKKRLCRRHTARFCSGDLHFWVQGGTLVVPPAHRK